MSRIAIIDGDIVLYKAAEAATEVLEVVEEDEISPYLYRVCYYGDKNKATLIVEEMVDKICKLTKSNDCILCLSDSQNFRKQLNPNYKLNRKKKMKPLLMEFLRNRVKELGYKVVQRPNLEADDVIGILATGDEIIKGDKCIWSLDKDFKTIPCKFAKGGIDGSLERMTITPEAADWWFMYQTLKGDPVDGYSGCKGIGDKLATKLLGKIGEKSLEEMWEIVQKTFKEKGYSEEEALLNARMARILRHTDYNFKTSEVRLWSLGGN